MKRILALILVLLTAFVLCAYGSNSDTQEANLESALEVDSEQQKQDEERLNQEEEQNKKVYEQATSYLEQGDLYHAAITFYSIADYADAREKCFETWHRITGYRTIAAGPIAIRENGTLWSNSSIAPEIFSWENIVSIQSGELGENIYALTSEGTILSTNERKDFSAWHDIVAFYVSYDCSSEIFAIKADGTVICDSIITNRTYDLSDWTDIVQIALGESGIYEGGGGFAIGLKCDGTLVGIGSNEYGQLNLRGRSDFVRIAAGCSHVVALKNDGTVEAFGKSGPWLDVSEWSDIVDVYAKRQCTIGIKSDGTVLICGEMISDNVLEYLPDMHDISEIVIDSPWIIALGQDGTLQTNMHTVHVTEAFRKPDVFYLKYSQDVSEGEKWLGEFSSKMGKQFDTEIQEKEIAFSKSETASEWSYGELVIYPIYRINGKVSLDGTEKQFDWKFPINARGLEYYKYSTYDSFVQYGNSLSVKTIMSARSGSELLVRNVVTYGAIISFLCGTPTPEDGNIRAILDARDAPQVIGDWTFTMTLNEAEDTVTIHAEYNKQN